MAAKRSRQIDTPWGHVPATKNEHRSRRQLSLGRPRPAFALRSSRSCDGKARFHVVHYSIQSNHLHLICEAQEHRELTSGLRSLVIRVAMRVNKLLGRARGKVWSDRYHREDLTCPNQVRNTMVYVLKNHVKHGQAERVGRMDPFSSARWFEGWLHREGPPESAPSPMAAPSTWLLYEGWKRTRKGRYLHPDEKPMLRMRKAA
jgi:putative transposase